MAPKSQKIKKINKPFYSFTPLLPSGEQWRVGIPILKPSLLMRSICYWTHLLIKSLNLEDSMTEEAWSMCTIYTLDLSSESNCQRTDLPKRVCLSYCSEKRGRKREEALPGRMFRANDMTHLACLLSGAQLTRIAQHLRARLAKFLSFHFWTKPHTISSHKTHQAAERPDGSLAMQEKG